MIAMTQKLFAAKLALSSATGQCEGAEVVCRWLREQAGKAFAARDDKRAHALREMADELVRYVLPDLQVKMEGLRVEIQNQGGLPPEEEPER